MFSFKIIDYASGQENKNKSGTEVSDILLIIVADAEYWPYFVVHFLAWAVFALKAFQAGENNRADLSDFGGASPWPH